MSKIKYFIVVLFVAALVGYNKVNDTKSLSDIALMNIEALSRDENKDGKYDYTTWSSDTCWILVGGAYAAGKKVSCRTGTNHPVCVDCQL